MVFEFLLAFCEDFDIVLGLDSFAMETKDALV